MSLLPIVVIITVVMGLYFLPTGHSNNQLVSKLFKIYEIKQPYKEKIITHGGARDKTMLCYLWDQ